MVDQNKLYPEELVQVKILKKKILIEIYLVLVDNKKLKKKISNFIILSNKMFLNLKIFNLKKWLLEQFNSLNQFMVVTEFEICVCDQFW